MTKRRHLLNRLYKGDCRKGMKTLADGIIDLTVTSPPWDNIFQYGPNNNWNWNTFTEVADELYRVTKPGGIVCWDIADGVNDGVCTGTTERMAVYFLNIGFSKFEKLVIHNHMRIASGDRRHGLPPEEVYVLSKGKPTTVHRRTKPNRPSSVGMLFDNYQQEHDGPIRDADRSKGTKIKAEGKRGAVWNYHPICPKCGTEWSGKMRFSTWPQFDETSPVRPYYNNGAAGYTRVHRARMSIALVKDLILAYSNPGDVVLDPFCGSGTTPKCAIVTGRRFMACEIEEEFQILSDRRIKDALDSMARRGLVE